MKAGRAASVLTVTLLAILAHAPASTQTNKSSPAIDELKRRAETAGTVRVIVQLDTNSVLVMHSSPGTGLTSKERIARAAAGVLNRINPSGKRGVKRYKHLPLLALEVNSAGLSEILASPESLNVYEDRAVPPALAQSVPLVGAAVAFASGHTGLGQAIAMLDTGVDRIHPFLWPRVVCEA